MNDCVLNYSVWKVIDVKPFGSTKNTAIYTHELRQDYGYCMHLIWIKTPILPKLTTTSESEDRNNKKKIIIIKNETVAEEMFTTAIFFKCRALFAMGRLLTQEVFKGDVLGAKERLI